MPRHSAKWISLSVAFARNKPSPATIHGRSASSSMATAFAIPLLEGAGEPKVELRQTECCAVELLSISSGKLITTGPGRPELAMWKALSTISATRSARLSSTAHLATGRVNSTISNS